MRLCLWNIYRVPSLDDHRHQLFDRPVVSIETSRSIIADAGHAGSHSRIKSTTIGCIDSYSKFLLIQRRNRGRFLTASNSRDERPNENSQSLDLLFWKVSCLHNIEGIAYYSKDWISSSLIKHPAALMCPLPPYWRQNADASKLLSLGTRMEILYLPLSSRKSPTQINASWVFSRRCDRIQALGRPSMCIMHRRKSPLSSITLIADSNKCLSCAARSISRSCPVRNPFHDVESSNSFIACSTRFFDTSPVSLDQPGPNVSRYNPYARACHKGAYFWEASITSAVEANLTWIGIFSSLKKYSQVRAHAPIPSLRMPGIAARIGSFWRVSITFLWWSIQISLDALESIQDSLRERSTTMTRSNLETSGSLSP